MNPPQPECQVRRHGRLSLLRRLVAAGVVWFTVVVLVMVLVMALVPSSTARSGHVGVTTGAGWIWPVEPMPSVERPFERPASRFGPGHRGVDLTVEPDRAVLAVADGVVTHSGMVAGRGTVTVVHASGVASTYEPVDDRILEGASVTAGTRLGTVGTGSHCAKDACLHLGARLGEDYLDPLLLLTRARIILLPLLGSG